MWILNRVGLRSVQIRLINERIQTTVRSYDWFIQTLDSSPVLRSGAQALNKDIESQLDENDIKASD